MRKHYGVGKACVLLAAALSFSVIGVPAVMAVPSASQRVQALIETAIPHTQLEGEGHRDGNFFRFSPKGWTALGGAGNTCIDCAKVVVRHEPYMPTKLEAAAGSASFTLREGGKAQIALSTAPDYISNADLDFVSRDPKIASVDENGAITAEGRGKTVITVSPKAAGERAVRPLEIAVTVAESPVIDGFISDVDTQWT